jgi:hypothetical protein
MQDNDITSEMAQEVKPLASLWPSRKTLKNDVKLPDPIYQDDDDDIDWLSIGVKKDEEDIKIQKEEPKKKAIFNLDDEPVGIHKKGFGFN